jgi:competence protein ComEC
MINTHFDEDHYGGLTTVLNNYVVEKFWCTSFKKSGTTLDNFKNAVQKEGLSLTTPSVGTTYTYEALTLTVLYSGAGAENSNDSSLVVMLEYGSFRFLFTGDISSTIETKLVQSKTDLTCDVLKVAHHGSRYSSNSSFLKATGAKYGVICVGTNTYGHPTSTALNNLSAAGISVYRTDKNGTVVFTTNGTTMQLPNNGGNVNKTSTATSSETTIAKQQQALLSAAYVYLPTLSKRNYLY